MDATIVEVHGLKLHGALVQSLTIIADELQVSPATIIGAAIEHYIHAHSVRRKLDSMRSTVVVARTNGKVH